MNNESMANPDILRASALGHNLRAIPLWLGGLSLVAGREEVQDFFTFPDAVVPSGLTLMGLGIVSTGMAALRHSQANKADAILKPEA